MKRHTLKELEKHYNPNTIQIRYGAHIVNIDLDLLGSHFLFKAFENTKYNFVSFNNGNLIVYY